MLEVTLRHGFPGFTLEASFAAPAEGVTVLFGPSGCGKSTLLAAVAGLLRPEAGRIALGGAVLFDSRAGVMLPPERRRCGVVFQDARLFPHLSVEANLRYGLRRAPRGAEGPDFSEVVELLGIGTLLGRRPALLSGGEKQRVALGRALLSRPRLLLMDEPLAALDQGRKAEVLPFLARLKQRLRLPILYVTHAMAEVDRLADTLVLMQAGRVLASGPVEEVAARTDLPLLGARRDAGVVLACRVLRHDTAQGLTHLAFPGGELAVPLATVPEGGPLRLRLRARDVVLATEAPRGLSVRNILPVVVEGLAAAEGHAAMLRLRAGPSLILARVTREAVARLALAPGQAAWALVKAVALSGPDGEEAPDD
ncbi:molybdenum ABC transporter ATP-binding protein [Roseomonas sp. GC11]|uniref:molybdenum ABC transporter ATP-binding protein n=1 Tax=Roseomonas sp. GC11 TaxID=2950546 RepID=UPI00210BBE40|nr:molybdenum ABC transporter ATP-binding protein [Roseomonas sp. GC11]MCQ4159683.1 molybdenum ABC transporter ATP-binding protein [Roseomonas sp. GC11]